MQILQQRGGVSVERSAELAIALVVKVAESWGGDWVRIPKGTWNGRALRWFELAERDWAIYREANRRLEKHEREAICEKYNICESRLYQIVAICRELDRAQRAAPLAIKRL